MSEALQGIDKKGNYANSKHPSSGAPKFIKSTRMAKVRDNGVPGPGSYENVLALSRNSRSSRDNFTLASYLNPRTTEFGKYSSRFETTLTPA